MINKLRFWLGPDNRLRQTKKLRRLLNKRKRIKIAVAGSASSGKSFLLNDLMSSLKKMGANFYTLTDDLEYYRSFGSYSPDEFGGNNGTPLYACRGDNHYGAYVNSTNSALSPFEIDFLNIPGEIFQAAEEGFVSRLKAYIMLKDCIESMPKVFAVTLWTSDSGQQRYIVEPASAEVSGVSESVRQSTRSIPHQLRLTRYKNWDEIYGELNAGRYKPCAGSRRKIRGRTLLRHFFEYDTDSVMMSIEDLISNGRMPQCGFGVSDYRNQKYDISFTFFQYCSQATDVVLCDRIFRKDVGDAVGNDELDLGSIAEGMYYFYDRRGEQKPNFYLAFRNIDYLLAKKEPAYKRLYKEILSGYGKTDRLNTIYSLFAYAMLHYLESGIEIAKTEDFCDFIGIDDSMVSEVGGINPSIKAISESMIDFDGGGGIIHNDNSNGLCERLKSAIGDSGSSFQRLLTLSGYERPEDDDPRAGIVPHVYYSCTPITEDFDIYHNYCVQRDGTDIVASDFERVTESGTSYFSRCHSNACFGSYQLCMDILTHHDKGDFTTGSLLKILQGIT